MNPWSNFPFKKRFYKSLLTALVILSVIGLMVPAFALAEPSLSLQITGDGVTTPLELTRAELEAMEQYQQVYSTINTWPTKSWYVARGVKLRQLLAMAGIKEEAKLIKVVSADGYEVPFTVKQLLKEKRYYFPGLKENHLTDGSIPGSPEGAVEVESVLALTAAEGSDDPEDMNDRDSLLLVMGQRAVTEQTNTVFVKYVTKIEVLTTEPERWDNPTANIPSGSIVPKGTMVRLSSKLNSEDKVHYTIDGSTPTVESPMYNWCASRWWPLREDLDSVNRPIVIERDMVIKAVTIGPGKEDSEVVTFAYTVDPTGQAVDPTKVSGGPPTGVTLDRKALSLRVGGSFQLAATIAPFNADDQSVIWSSSDTSVATVDTRGLVTVVGPGTATITARTVDGNHMAACVVDGGKERGEGDRSQEASTENGLPSGWSEQEAGQGAAAAAITTSGQTTGNSDQPPSNEGLGSEPLTETSDEPPLNGQLAAETPKEASPAPEGMQYLARKEDLAAAPLAADIPSEQRSGRSWQVFEVSLAAGVPPLPEEEDRVNTYAAAIFFVLFLSGAAKSCVEYAKER